MLTSGLVLCGGKSSRMGRDKAFIKYHEKEQIFHVYDMLKQCCDEVYISCNAEQLHKIDASYKTIVDHPVYKDAGPMTGLLSAFHSHPQQSFLVVGCDYPYLTSDDIKTVLANASEDTDVVCMRNLASEMDEPLIAWYHDRTFHPMMQAYHADQRSLRHLIQTLHTQSVLPENALNIRSVDTGEEC